MIEANNLSKNIYFGMCLHINFFRFKCLKAKSIYTIHIRKKTDLQFDYYKVLIIIIIILVILY